MIERNEKVLFLTTKNMRQNIKNNNIYNYFIDTTYKIIPKKLKPYRLMTISCFNNKDNITNICCFILYKYEDHISLYHIFKYLNNFFQFNPKIINIDFS